MVGAALGLAATLAFVTASGVVAAFVPAPPFANAGTNASGIAIDGAGVETGGAGFFETSATAVGGGDGGRDGACATGAAVGDC